MYQGNMFYALQQVQLQRSLGELSALLSMHYDPAVGRDERYTELENLIKSFKDDIRNLIG